MSFNIAMLLRESSRKEPNKTALILGEHKMTYQALYQAACQFGSNLQAL